jgi:tripeptidyl-peptidase-1
VIRSTRSAFRPVVSPYEFTLTHGRIGCHRRYGAHLSKEQVAELVAAHPDTIELVGAWLEHHGVPASSVSVTHGGSWLTLSGVPLAQADALLCASYRLYRHTETNEMVLRTTGYSLPAVLHGHVRLVPNVSEALSKQLAS